MDLEVLTNFETEDLIWEIESRGDDYMMEEACSSTMIKRKDVINPKTLEKDNLKRYLCDMVDVGYHTNIDEVFNLLKNKINGCIK